MSKAKTKADSKGRIKSRYPGVFSRESKHPQTGKADERFYIRYRRDGKQVEEAVGWRSGEWTAAKASNERSLRIEGKAQSNEDRRQEQRAAKLAEESRWTLSRLWSQYKAQRVENKALKVDNGRFVKHLKPDFGNKTPDEIITLEVDRLRLKLLKKLSPQTVKHVLALLKRIIKFGVKRDLIDPPSPRRLHIEMPTVDNLVTEHLSNDQLKKLLETLDEEPNWKARGMVRLALCSGLRRGEMFKLKWQDLDFQNRIINLRDTKSGKTHRIPMNDAARDLFKTLPKETSHVFPGEEDAQLQNIDPALRRIKKRAGLPKSFRMLHGLRHDFASRLASSGKVGLYELQRLLTHGDSRMTQRYAHLADEALQKASAVAGEVFSTSDDEKSKIVNLAGNGS